MPNDTLEEYRVYQLRAPLDALVDLVLEGHPDPKMASKRRKEALAWIQKNVSSYLDYWPQA